MLTGVPDCPDDDAPGPAAPPAVPASDPLDLLVDVPLSVDEAGYVTAARAANTLRGYRSDWAEFTTWCTTRDPPGRPPSPATSPSWRGTAPRSAP